MKQVKTLLSGFLILMCLSVSFAKEYSFEEKEAYNYSYWNYITTVSSIDSADMWWNLTRIAMAKMISNYAINILGLVPDTSKNCFFSDVSNDLDYQYGNWVTKACQLGLMWVWIEKFNPNWKVTRAEFGTVLSRALNSESPIELEKMNDSSPYYYEHLKYLSEKWIMNDISNPGSLERRWRVMLMLMRSDENYENSFEHIVFLSKNNMQGILDTLWAFKVQKRDYNISTSIDSLGVDSGYLSVKGWTKVDNNSKKEDAFLSFDMGMRETDLFDIAASGLLNYSLLWNTMYFNLSDFSFKNSSPDQLSVMTTMVDDLKWKRFKLEMPVVDVSSILEVYEEYRAETYDLISESYDMINSEWSGIYDWHFDEYNGLSARNYSIDKDDVRDVIETYFDTIQGFYSDLYAVQGLWNNIESEDFFDLSWWLSDIVDGINWYYVVLGKNEVVQTFEGVKLEFSDGSQMLLDGHYWTDWLYVEAVIDGEKNIIDIKNKNNNYTISIMFGDWFEITWSMKVYKFSKDDWIDLNFDLNMMLDLDQLSYDENEGFDDIELDYPSKIIVPIKWSYSVTKISWFDVSKHSDAVDLEEIFGGFMWLDD